MIKALVERYVWLPVKKGTVRRRFLFVRLTNDLDKVAVGRHVPATNSVTQRILFRKIVRMTIIPILHRQDLALFKMTIFLGQSHLLVTINPFLNADLLRNRVPPRLHEFLVRRHVLAIAQDKPRR